AGSRRPRPCAGETAAGSSPCSSLHRSPGTGRPPPRRARGSASWEKAARRTQASRRWPGRSRGVAACPSTALLARLVSRDQLVALVGHGLATAVLVVRGDAGQSALLGEIHRERAHG